MVVHYRARGPAQYGVTDVGHEVHEGRRQTGRRTVHAGSRLKLIDVLGRSRLTSQPSSRTGENPPYGMIGGIEETSASFEARYAPRSYPTTKVPTTEAGAILLPLHQKLKGDRHGQRRATRQSGSQKAEKREDQDHRCGSKSKDHCMAADNRFRKKEIDVCRRALDGATAEAAPASTAQTCLCRCSELRRNFRLPSRQPRRTTTE